MKRVKLIYYGCCYKLFETDREKLYQIPVCGTPKYASEVMIKAKDNGLK